MIEVTAHEVEEIDALAAKQGNVLIVVYRDKNTHQTLNAFSFVRFLTTDEALMSSGSDTAWMMTDLVHSKNFVFLNVAELLKCFPVPPQEDPDEPPLERAMYLLAPTILPRVHS